MQNRVNFPAAIFRLLLVLSLAISAFAQSPKPAETQAAKVENFQLSSKLMKRQMPYRVVFPKSYETEKTKRYPVIYLLHGLTGHFNNWTELTKLAQYAAAYDFLIVTPEGGDGWYVDSISKPNDRFETYIVEEMLPEIDKNFRTINDRGHRAIAGLSMGGYGSVKFGLKYPEKFFLVGSFSGALEAASMNEKNIDAWISKSIMEVFGSESSETRKANDIFRMVREMPAEKIKNLPFIYVDCGTEDLFIQSNREFMQALSEKKIPHEYRQKPGAHNWAFWNSEVQEFLRLNERLLKAKSN